MSESMLEEVAPDLSLQRHELRLMGCKMGRVVTLIRLNSGKVIIHSTAKFTKEDISEICEFGDPAWLVEATNFHDTYAEDGRRAFPDIPYFVPPGFIDSDSLGSTCIDVLPEEWNDEVLVIRIEGMPKIQEHVVYHKSSKTLVVADLLFNISPDSGWWTHRFLRMTAGILEYPGMSRFFRYFIKDRRAFVQSMEAIAALDFERVVVAHGDPIVDDAKAKFLGLLAKHDINITT